MNFNVPYSFIKLLRLSCDRLCTGSIENFVVLEEGDCLFAWWWAVVCNAVWSDVDFFTDSGDAGEATTTADFQANPAPHEPYEEVSLRNWLVSELQLAHQCFTIDHRVRISAGWVEIWDWLDFSKVQLLDVSQAPKVTKNNQREDRPAYSIDNQSSWHQDLPGVISDTADDWNSEEAESSEAKEGDHDASKNRWEVLFL